MESNWENEGVMNYNAIINELFDKGTNMAQISI